MPRYLVLMIVIFASLLMTAMFVVGYPLLFGAGFGFDDTVRSNSAWLMAAATLGGVFCSVLVTGLKTLPTEKAVNVSALIQMLARPGSLVAFLVSPIAFLSTLAAANAQSVSALGYLAAFQNGFFWQQILKQKEELSDHPSGSSR